MAEPDNPPAASPAPAGKGKTTRAPKPHLPGRNTMILAAVGVVVAVLVAFVLNRPIKPQAPAFQPAANPYAQAIFANGIIESDQSSGANVNIFPEVSGRVTEIFVSEGQAVRAGQPLFTIDDSVQRATTEQARLQAEGAKTLLAELKAEPRRETLAVAQAQAEQARANLVTLQHQRDKLQRSAALDARAVSQNSLDSAIDSAKSAQAALEVAERNLALIRAGAWAFDVRNQASQAAALTQAYESDKALLGKYHVRAPIDGRVISLNLAKGGYVSSSGAYDAYTQANLPAAVLASGGSAGGTLSVRVYVDEILLSRLPKSGRITAEMSIRGANHKVPLQFVRIQPLVSPKVELSTERQEQVDLRVLPVIFRFPTDPNFPVYPGEEVDVYINEH